jgi:hypothetical protein
MIVTADQRKIPLFLAFANDIFTARRVIEQRFIGDEFLTFFRPFKRRLEPYAVVFCIGGVEHALGRVEKGVIAGRDFTLFMPAAGREKIAERRAELREHVGAKPPNDGFAIEGDFVPDFIAKMAGAFALVLAKTNDCSLNFKHGVPLIACEN